jgi:CRP/FNR family transcriptional regulator
MPGICTVNHFTVQTLKCGRLFDSSDGYDINDGLEKILPLWQNAHQMDTNDMAEDMVELTSINIEKTFSYLLDPAKQKIKDQFLKHASVKQFPAGHYICWEGDVCTHLAVVLSGSVRVYKTGESGREITLYRIEENDSCVLTASCILSQIRFPALAMVEKEVRAVLIPAQILREWIGKYDVWRVYVFELMSKRLADVIATVEEIAFRRVDVRIAEFLAGFTVEQEPITITHQEIADELGTSREVVSRILKDFERGNIISQSRGSIIIQNKHALLERINSP